MTTKQTTGKKKESKKEIEQLKKELKEKNEKILRNMADFENYRKRIQKEIQQTEQNIKQKYLSEIIDTYELLKKAFEDNNPKEGLKLILANLDNFMECEKIEKIECIGEKFDHNIHHAVTTVEKKDCEDNTIIEEVKKGYKIDDKILRPSQVIVAKNK